MIEYTIDTSIHLLEVRVNGSIGLLELVNFVVRAQKDLQYGPSINTLFIVEPDADLVKLTPDSLLTFFRRAEGSGGSATWAIVASNE